MQVKQVAGGVADHGLVLNGRQLFCLLTIPTLVSHLFAIGGAASSIWRFLSRRSVVPPVKTHPVPKDDCQQRQTFRLASMSRS